MLTSVRSNFSYTGGRTGNSGQIRETRTFEEVDASQSEVDHRRESREATQVDQSRRSGEELLSKYVAKRNASSKSRSKSVGRAPKPVPNLTSMDRKQLRQLELLALEHDLWSNSRSLPNSSFTRWGMKPFHCYAVCDCNRACCDHGGSEGSAGSHKKPGKGPAGSGQLMEFIERKVPPEIRRYVLNGDKLAQAESELSKLWATAASRHHPHGDGDDDELAELDAKAREDQLKLARAEMRQRLTQKLRSYEAVGVKSQRIQEKLANAENVSASLASLKLKQAGDRARVVLTRMEEAQANLEAEEDKQEVEAEEEKEGREKVKPWNVQPPPVPTTRREKQQRQAVEVSRAVVPPPPQPKAKLYGTRKPESPQKQPQQQHSRSDNILPSSPITGEGGFGSPFKPTSTMMTSSGRLPVVTPDDDDIIIAKARDVSKRVNVRVTQPNTPAYIGSDSVSGSSEKGGRQTASVGGTSTIKPTTTVIGKDVGTQADVVFGRSPRPVVKQSIAAILSQRDETGAPIVSTQRSHVPVVPMRQPPEPKIKAVSKQQRPQPQQQRQRSLSRGRRQQTQPTQDTVVASTQTGCETVMTTGAVTTSTVNRSQDSPAGIRTVRGESASDALAWQQFIHTRAVDVKKCQCALKQCRGGRQHGWNVSGNSGSVAAALVWDSALMRGDGYDGCACCCH